jgi:DNA-binding transcriptional LysR family regulator
MNTKPFVNQTIGGASIAETSFDWALMPSFLAVLDAGSLLGAAKRLKQSQPTLGRHVAMLESQLGAALFERTGRGLAPTEIAQRIATYARGMQDSADALQRSLSASAQVLTGSVRITTSQTAAAHLLPSILLKMRRELPEIQIEVVATNEVKNLLRREADIAVRMVRPDQDSLIARKIAQIGIGAYAHASYLKRRGVPKNPADLLNHELIGYDQDVTILRGFRAFGESVTREHFAFRCDDHNVHWEALRAGLGVAFVSHYLASTDGKVKRVVPQLRIPDLPVWLTTHREIHGNPRIRRVFDFLAQSIAESLSRFESST